MNASPLSSAHLAAPAEPSGVVSSDASTPARRSLRSLLGTITGICFILGALMAVQLRTIKNIQDERKEKTQSDVLQKQIVEKNRLATEKSARLAEQKRHDLAVLVNHLRSTNGASDAQIKALTAQIKDLQSLACLTPMSGQGIRIVLADNPQAGAAGTNSPVPLPGLVHDYDVLQVVNELRAAKADAIAVSGAGGKAIRITGTTPIRCVGPVIFINWRPVAAPFSIEAVGEAATLRSAVEMPGGIIENMRTQGAVGVKVSSINDMTVPPADGASGVGTTTRVSLPASPVKSSLVKGA